MMIDRPWPITPLGRHHQSLPHAQEAGRRNWRPTPYGTCAVFVQKPLELLAEGQIPAPGILPDAALDDELSKDELNTVVGGIGAMLYVYPTGDQKIGADMAVNN